MKVYKYRTFNENNINSLIENYFWCSSKEDLNDPCEGFFTDNTLIKELKGYKFLANLTKATASFDGFLQSYDDLKKLLLKQGVFSTSKSPFIHTLWSLYADTHKGFCVEYDLEELKAKNPSFYQSFDVNYLDEPQDLKFSDLELTSRSQNSHRLFFQKVIGTKHTDWNKEQEVRILSAEIGKNYHHQNAITAVYFGQNCSEENRNLMMKNLANRKIQFRQILKSSNSFNLSVENITNPFDTNEMNSSVARIEDLAIYEKGIKEEYTKYIPYLYKVAEIMQKDPDCEVIETIDFSQDSTKDNPIIYVNFQEKNKSIPYSQKRFTLQEIDNTYSLIFQSGLETPSHSPHLTPTNYPTF